MRDLSLLTWNEVRETDKSRSVVFVVLAPIEEHGTHLPLATDILEGDTISITQSGPPWIPLSSMISGLHTTARSGSK